MATSAAELRKQELAYYAYPKTVSVPSELWAEFKRIRESTRIQAMTKK